jgi:hypothetical protein
LRDYNEKLAKKTLNITVQILLYKTLGEIKGRFSPNAEFLTVSLLGVLKTTRKWACILGAHNNDHASLSPAEH